MKRVAFGVSCAVTVLVLRLWIRAHPDVGAAWPGQLALALAVVWGWCILMQWRDRKPRLAYALLGVCAGVGGAGLHEVLRMVR